MNCTQEPLFLGKVCQIKHMKKGASVIDAPFVRSGGLEPPRLAAIDPKSIAATSYATTACSSSVCRGTGIRTPDLLLPKQTR